MSTTTAQPKLKRKSAMLNLFVSPKEINKLKADLQLRQNRRKPPLPTTSPDPPKPTSPAPAPTAPAEPTPPTPWTTAEDIAILHLKGTDKTFAEIATSLSPRTETEIETRFKEIGLPATTTTAEAENVGENPAASIEPTKPATTTNANEGKGAGAKAQKGGKQKGEGNKQKSGGNPNPPGGKKGKGKAAEPSTTPAAAAPPTSAPQPADDNEPTDPFTDPTGASAASPSKNNEAVIANKVDQKVRGILKRGVNGTYSQEEMVIPFGATSVNGRPIIYIEENDPLGVEDV
ncbi:MAG: hypothetical protein L6R42_008269 [Xanthoria sp. 1 TBL-2021]|nr:MAG: hypothetical protein L6R42_008269 [Xanthoria sp. 1 TBL-2021]